MERFENWRGDLDFSSSEFNEVDNLILSRLAYFPFDGVIKEGEEITLKESYSRYKNIKNKAKILIKGDIDFFPILAKSIRFGNLKITKYINKVDSKEEKQFSAVTILLPDDTIFVSYRGTDNTIVRMERRF